MEIVESHVHIWTTDPSVRAHPDPNVRPRTNAPPDELFKAQREVGNVTYTVLIQPRCYLWDNTYLAQTAEVYQDRLVVVGRVNPFDPEAANQLRELMQWPGYRGIRLAPIEDPATVWLDHHSQNDLWEAAAETNATIGLLIKWFQLPQAEEIASRHPTVTVVIDHLGLPDYDDPMSLENLISLVELPNVYVKLSGYPHNTGSPYPYTRARTFIDRTLTAFGSSRIMWGSDWPVCLPYATYGQAFTSAWNLEALTIADRHWIFRKTALEAWRIPGS